MDEVNIARGAKKTGKNGRDPIYGVLQFIEVDCTRLNICTSVHFWGNTRDFPRIGARIPLNELTDAINGVPTLLERSVKKVSVREVQ
jgi:hypothetical protein